MAAQTHWPQLAWCHSRNCWKYQNRDKVDIDTRAVPAGFQSGAGGLVVGQPSALPPLAFPFGRTTAFSISVIAPTLALPPATRRDVLALEAEAFGSTFCGCPSGRDEKFAECLVLDATVPTVIPVSFCSGKGSAIISLVWKRTAPLHDYMQVLNTFSLF